MKVEDFTITDNSDKILEAMEDAVERVLETMGLTAEVYAKNLCPVDTGNLRNSITHQVDTDENAVYVGTNSEYAAYVELGTGTYYPGGRKTPWVFQDSKGEWHRTNGQKAQPFLKPAVADHASTYRKIVKDGLKNG